MKSLYLVLVFIISAAHASQPQALDGRDNTWNGWNDPAKMDSGFEYAFSKLPLEGEIHDRNLGWQGFHWANNKGGIAHRWRAEKPMDFKYPSPDLSRLSNMSFEARNQLSPAEKYDLFMGRYDYPTVSTVWGQTRRGHKEWYGICHGVAPSSLNHPEPESVTLQNKDGVEITFYSSDIKALMAYYYAKVSDAPSVQIGKRCFVAGWLPIVRRMAGCSDVNPGAFHVIMANRLGLMKKGFIADMERYSPVWNHPAVKYSSRVLETASPDKRSSEDAVRRVLVESDVSFSASIDPSEGPVVGTELAEFEERKFKYWLELDYRDRIIGGSWVSGIRPDFLWVKDKDEFSGYWSGLNHIVGRP